MMFQVFSSSWSGLSVQWEQQITRSSLDPRGSYHSRIPVDHKRLYWGLSIYVDEVRYKDYRTETRRYSPFGILSAYFTHRKTWTVVRRLIQMQPFDILRVAWDRINIMSSSLTTRIVLMKSCSRIVGSNFPAVDVDRWIGGIFFDFGSQLLRLRLNSRWWHSSQGQYRSIRIERFQLFFIFTSVHLYCSDLDTHHTN